MKPFMTLLKPKTALELMINLFIWLCFAVVLTTPMTTVSADTQNYSVSQSGVVTIPIQVSGQYIATTDPVARFKLPFAAQLIGVTATARASGGTSPTLTVDLEDDGTTVLSSAISITAGTVSEGTITSTSVADESLLDVVLTIGGTSPTWDDITVLITVIRI